MSVDGLQPGLVEAFAALGADGPFTNPRGFSWLLANSLVVDRAQPVITTLTAPSHISTITCTPPSRHGIVANEFWRGNQLVGGFDAAIKTEALWQSAQRQGKKVLCLAYVGCDGETPERRANFGLAYPKKSELGEASSGDWALAELPTAVDWVLPDGKVPRQGAREVSLDVKINRLSGEVRSLRILVEPATTEHALRVWVGLGKDLRGGATALGPLSHADLLLDEAKTAGASAGRKRRLSLALRLQPGRVGLEVGAATYNRAYPESFRRQLDEAGLVWPPDDMHGAAPASPTTPTSMGAIDRFLAEVAAHVVGSLGVDVVLAYQPLIDALGHQLQSSLPPAPTTKIEALKTWYQLPVVQTFARAFAVVDADLQRFFATADATTPIVLLGDHGMDAIKYIVNPWPLLAAGRRQLVRLHSSGQMLFLYPAPGASVSAAEEVGAALAKTLTALRNAEGGKVLAAAMQRRDFGNRPSSDFRREWQYGEALWVFLSASGHWLKAIDQSANAFLPPTVPGMHGTLESLPPMATMMFVHGAGVPHQHLPRASSIMAVPSISHLMGIAAPKDCLGSSLVP